jgi:hypothetical protein
MPIPNPKIRAPMRNPMTTFLSAGVSLYTRCQEVTR